MKSITKSLLVALLCSCVLNVKAQTIDYLKPVGQNLAADIVNQNTSALISKEAMAVYFKKAIMSGLNQELTDAQIEQAINQGINSTAQAYKDAISQLYGFIDEAKMDTEEFSLWANVPLKIEVHESKSSGVFSVPDPNKDNLSTLNVHFLLGDIPSRIILPATVVALNGAYHIIKIESPESYFQFIEGDYGAIYSNMYSLIEKQLNGSSGLADGSPLIGDKFNEDWYKCTIQLVGNTPPTLIRTLTSSDEFFDLSLTTEVKVDLFNDINYEEGLSYLYDLLSVFAQGFNIKSANEQIRIQTYQALSENKADNSIAANLKFKRSSRDVVVFDMKLILKPTLNNKYMLVLKLVNED